VEEETADLPPTPNNWAEAYAGPWADKWRAAKKKEEVGLESQKTWEVVQNYKGRTVKSRWAFRVSRESDGSLKFRARLVAKGFSEVKGVDYFATFSPTVSSKALMILLHLAASEDWEIRSVDVGNAYLESLLDVPIYMELPPEPDQPRQVVLLKKSLYGLKQAGELWNRLLDSILKILGFTRCHSDPCVYHRVDSRGKIFIAVYVDDLLILSSTLQLAKDFEEGFAQHVKRLTVKGDAEGFVGLEFKRSRANRTITVTQTQYIKDVVHSEGLDHASPKSTPASVSNDLNKAERGTKDPMRMLVGKVRYLVDHTRPEALFVASQLSSACASPGEKHWDAVNYLLRYFKGSPSTGITLGGHDKIEPEMFVDASYIEDGDAKSQLGYCMRMSKSAGMVLNRSIRDKSVSLSASEAELRALKEATQDALWTRYFLKEIGYGSKSPIPIHEDNQAVIDLTETLKNPSRTRHLNKIKKFVTEKIARGRIQIRKIPGEDNIADILTKSLDKARFQKLRKGLLGEK